MKKLIGIALFLAVLYAAVLAGDEAAWSEENHRNLGERIGLYGLVGLGAGLLIIVGGIDLSIGSVAGLSATVLAMLMAEEKWHPLAAMGFAIAMGGVIGLVHGLIVTKLRVQAFVVTLCGLFIYKGLARWLAEDTPKGLKRDFKEWRQALYGDDVLGLPNHFAILLILAGVVTVFLHFSVRGRYLYAIGNNEKAAAYSGIKTDRYKILAYVLCSALASCFGILYLMKHNYVEPSNPMPYLELYAIAAAVLGGCSLRGGEGTVLGILIGTCILQLLRNLVIMWDIPSALEPAVVGGALLLGAMLDESMRFRRVSVLMAWLRSWFRRPHPG